MKRLKAILLTLIPCINLYGQINISDSTVQISGFWSKGDKKTYSITQKKINIKGADTLSNEQTKFYVDIIIIDSASESYTIDWCYYNHDNASSEKGEVRIITNDKGVLLSVEEKEPGKYGVYKEINQFFTYYGATARLGEVNTSIISVPYPYYEEPLDTKISVWLDEILPNDNTYVMQMSQTVDSEQLADVTYKYLKLLSESTVSIR
jgi:hypothetical protein